MGGDWTCGRVVEVFPYGNYPNVSNTYANAFHDAHCLPWPSRGHSQYLEWSTWYGVAFFEERTDGCTSQTEQLLLQDWCLYPNNLLRNILVLDPRISYEALKDEFDDDYTMLNQLEESKMKLQAHFNAKYMSSLTPSGSSRLSSTPSSFMLSVTSDSTDTTLQTGNSPQKNYMVRVQRKRVVAELSEFWNLRQEEFKTCNPVRWWYGRREQFPNLYRLLCDIFSIPGMFSAYHLSWSH